MEIINDIQSNYQCGYIKLFRSLKNKGWYKKSDFVHLWIHILIKANHKQTEFWFNGKNIILEPGQFVTGRTILHNETGIHESKIERILNFFEKIEHQIEQQKTSKNRLVSIVSWEQYQQTEQQTEQQLNNQRTTTEQPLNTYKNVKNNKNVKEEEYIYSKFYDSQIKDCKNEKYIQFVKYLFGENMLKKPLTGVLSIKEQLTQTEFEKILLKCTANKKKLGDIVTKIENDVKYYKGKKSLYRTLLNWSEDRFI